MTTTEAVIEDEPARGTRSWPRTVLSAVVAVVAVGVIFGCYLRLARAVGTNADGAGNVLQSWDLLHGHLLLSGWTVSDVPFYTVELVELALIELVTGLHPDALTAGAALSYTLIVVLVAVLARGRARGRAAYARMALALFFVLVPASGYGHAILLNQPDHTATAIPLLLAWLVLDRGTSARDGSARAAGRWLALWVGLVLVWGQVSDPLLLVIGALPLAVVSLIRLVAARRWSPRDWLCLDGGLLLAAVGSAGLARLVIWAIERAGGFTEQAVPSGFGVTHLARHLTNTRNSLGALFGCYFPDLHGWRERALGFVHLAGLALVVAALVLVIVRVAARRSDRIEELLALGIVVNLATFIFSVLNSDIASAREIAPVLPMSAVLVARAFARRSARPVLVGRAAPRAGLVVALAVAALMVSVLVDQVRVPAATPTGQAVADWLAAQHLDYGLGGYWVANPVTMDSGGRVAVRPVTSHGGQIQAYAWESRSDWYDPARHDARFIVIDLHNRAFGTVAEAIAAFGQPVRQMTLPTSPGRTATVLVYDHNLLAGLPAWCLGGRAAASMADC